jgi:HEPN domain-containing protein
MFYDVYPKKVNITSWHCQQCAEKVLKTYLISLGIEPPRIHDLGALCQLCAEHNTRFSEISNICKSLNAYGVVTRYPNELSIDDSIAENNITRAQKIYDFCCELITGAGEKEKNDSN